MTIHEPAIILVRPQMGENIGAAARAMLNFGLTDLRLVAPRDGWPSQTAIDMSSGALDRMPPVQVFATLPEAVADLHYVYTTTARPRDLNKPVLAPREATGDSARRLQNEQKTGFVFGPERTGLENEEIMRAQVIVTAPVNPDFPSINLAQTVLLIASEHFIATHETPGHDEQTKAPASIPATQAELEAMFARLETLLQDGGFFTSPEIRPAMIRNIRAMITRAAWTEQEVRTFQGIMTALPRHSHRTSRLPEDL